MRAEKALVTISMIFSVAGCGTVIEPGHRGLLFDPRRAGLGHEVLNPGFHRHAAWARVDDFDVTFSKHQEDIHTQSGEGLTLDAKLAVKYRPVVSQLYELDTEIGANYYDEVIGPEFRSAARGVFSGSSNAHVGPAAAGRTSTNASRMPAGKIPVGWNCTASMLPSAATPVSRASAWPMPSEIVALVVTRYRRPAPPVAIAVALAR